MLETRLSYQELMDTPDEVLDALVDILRKRAEDQEDERRQQELKQRFG